MVYTIYYKSITNISRPKEIMFESFEHDASFHNTTDSFYNEKIGLLKRDWSIHSKNFKDCLAKINESEFLAIRRLLNRVSDNTGNAVQAACNRIIHSTCNQIIILILYL